VLQEPEVKAEENKEEATPGYGGWGQITSHADMIDLILEVMGTDPPFRNFTTRLYARILYKLSPNLSLNVSQKAKLKESFYTQLDLMYRLVQQKEKSI